MQPNLIANLIAPTRDQLDLIRSLTRTKESIHTAVLQVLLNGIPVTRSALQAGIPQPSLSRAVARYQHTHLALWEAYNSDFRNSNELQN